MKAWEIEISYSEEALASIDLFFVGEAIAFFYFEDAGHETFYERFIQKLFPDFGPFKVICLGGKSQVLKKAEDDPGHNTPQFFVLDKDFDDILDKTRNIRSVFIWKNIVWRIIFVTFEVSYMWPLKSVRLLKVMLRPYRGLADMTGLMNT